MALRLSVPEFGGPLASFESNSDGTQLRADGCWCVDFGSFGPELAIDFSAIIGVGPYSLATSRIVLMASVADSNVAGVILAEIDPPLAGTGGGLSPFLQSVTVANPGAAYRYLVLASQGGQG